MYTTNVNVGMATSYTLPAFAEGTTVYLSATSYNAAGAESAHSAEVAYTVPSLAPVAAFSASTTSGVAPLALNFSSTSTGSISTYAWTFGDGTTSSSVTPAKVYSSAGVYTVSLTVTGPGGSNTLTKTNYITVTTGGDTTPPGVPTNVAATTTSTSSIKITWTAATDNMGVTAYYVERCQNAGCTAFAQIGSVTGTYYTSSGLVAGATYQYRVRAVDAAGNLGGYSAVVAATTSLTAVDKTPPSVPGSPSATAITSTSVDLKWTPSTDDVGVSGYILERCRGQGCKWYAQVAKTATPNFKDTSLSSSTTYRYRVRAYDAAGNIGRYSTTSTIKTPSAIAIAGVAGAAN
ncbi:MAG: fibronectin type III domain-containing protein [Burkholderiales bacterium]